MNIFLLHPQNYAKQIQSVRMMRTLETLRMLVMVNSMANRGVGAQTPSHVEDERLSHPNSC